MICHMTWQITITFFICDSVPRPLLEKETAGSKIWCASGVDLRGGRSKDGAKLVGTSVFYDSNSADSAAAANDLETLDSELKDGVKAANSTAESGFSSFVWICTSTHKESRVAVVDANDPAEVLDRFNVCSSHLLCIASGEGLVEKTVSKRLKYGHICKCYPPPQIRPPLQPKPLVV